MPSSFSPILLSGTPGSGQLIVVAATASPGTLIHTAIAGTEDFDEVYLAVSNVTGSAAKLTIEWGGVDDPADHLVKQYSVPARSAPILVADGLRVNGGVVIRAFSDTANALNISGTVNRIQ